MIVANFVPGQVLADQELHRLAAIATAALVTTWTMILVTQWRFREAQQWAGAASGLRFPMPCWPYSNYLAGSGMVLVIVMMAFRSDTRLARYVAPI